MEILTSTQSVYTLKYFGEIDRVITSNTYLEQGHFPGLLDKILAKHYIQVIILERKRIRKGACILWQTPARTGRASFWPCCWPWPCLRFCFGCGFPWRLAPRSSACAPCSWGPCSSPWSAASLLPGSPVFCRFAPLLCGFCGLSFPTAPCRALSPPSWWGRRFFGVSSPCPPRRRSSPA